jgi:hypothetical protein
MQPHDAELLKSDTVSLRLLTEYLSALDSALDEPAPARNPAVDEADGVEIEESSRTRWIPRIRQLDSIEPEKLSSAHGRLIAQGLLNFQVEDRTAGLCYRVTPEGRQVLSSLQSN